MKPPSERWQPSRAGIVNVYQYEDETLHFAGGRLLLRGVNGSGKSTAMNMLLPFLLEADTRRIDAAGEQIGVLKSWMLADSEETLRTGYLWIEFTRPDPDAAGGCRFHTVGCGIRAGRHTDRVTIWWFSTPRRAKIDFPLLERRVPLSAEALRAELGADAVFNSAADYRAEVARRFFGGVDPSAYLALLHQVRNPRVGDRIDAELPQRIREALPPVPEEAVADAAQPLEDLEDHRSNLTALERTDRALAGALEMYRSYARRVLHIVAARTAEVVSAARGALQLRGRLRAGAEMAANQERGLSERIGELAADRDRADARLTGLKDSPAYRDHKALLARRDHVTSLDARALALETDRTRARRRVDVATERADDLQRRVTGDLDRVTETLTELDRHARAAATILPLPDRPSLRTRPLIDRESGTQIQAAAAEDDPTGAVSRAVAPMGDAVRERRHAHATVTTAMGKAATAAEVAVRADADAERAAEMAAVAQARAAETRQAAERAGQAHRTAVLTWSDQLTARAAQVPAAEPGGAAGWLPRPSRPDPGGDDLRTTARARVQAAAATGAELTAALDPAVAAADVRVREAAADVQRVVEELAEVAAATELPLPRNGWQHEAESEAESFARLVDFRSGVEPAHRAGLEAALHASGLLSAIVRADGTVLAATGELLVVDGQRVWPNLTTVLQPDVAEPTRVSTEAVLGVLEQIGLSGESGAPLWIALDGRFGAGPMRGRHEKVAAEHVGAGAREAARQRRLAELRTRLSQARQRQSIETAIHAALRDYGRELRELIARIPSTAEIDDASAVAAGAGEDSRRAVETRERLREDAVAARRVAEEAWARAQTEAATAGLPLDESQLATIAAAIDEASAAVRALPGRLDTCRRSMSDWRAAVDQWTADTVSHADTAAAAVRAATDAAGAHIELATVEAALGEEPERVAQQVERAQRALAGLDEDLQAIRADHTAAVGAAATARARADAAEASAEAAEQECRRARATLLETCAIPGLFAAAQAAETGPTGPYGSTRGPGDTGVVDGDSEDGGTGGGEGGLAQLPAEPDTVDGTARLVAALRAAVPEPVQETSEDSLDRSLRAIRDSLGAGWDIEARRAADGSPLAVEVSGPYGRRALLDAAAQVTVDLRRARGLLSAKQDQALRNLLHGRVAREVASALFQARELIDGINAILRPVMTSQGIGVRLDWRTRSDLDPDTATALRLLAKDPGARTEDEDSAVRAAVSELVEDARAADPEASYRSVIGAVLDYRQWHELRLYLRRPGRNDELLNRRSRLSEGEKKLVTYLPMAAAAAASASAHDPTGVGAPRLVLLDDAFAKVSEDNHAQLFGLLVELDLDFVVTSERLWGTHSVVPELAITEVLRDPDLRTIALVHYRWDGRLRTTVAA